MAHSPPSTLCGFDNAAGRGPELLEQFGPTLVVDIGFDPTYVPTGGSPPDLAMKGVHALVDTGASISCIDSELAMNLGLPIVDQGQIAGAGGAKLVNMHLGQICIPLLGRTIFGRFAAVDLAAGGQAHSALIGRSFLRHFKMTYDGPTGMVLIGHPNAFDIVVPPDATRPAANIPTKPGSPSAA
jgi:hypothetical protein